MYWLTTTKLYRYMYIFQIVPFGGFTTANPIEMTTFVYLQCLHRNQLLLETQVSYHYNYVLLLLLLLLCWAFWRAGETQLVLRVQIIFMVCRAALSLSVSAASRRCWPSWRDRTWHVVSFQVSYLFKARRFLTLSQFLVELASIALKDLPWQTRLIGLTS